MPVKILLADKSITIQKVVEMLFSGKEYEVTCVSDGDSAFGEASRIVPDVVLADVDLPRIDGYSLAGRLRETAALAKVPVILMLSRDDVYDAMKGKLAGILDNIAKPFESQDLIGKVKKALSAAPAPAERPSPSPTSAAAPIPSSKPAAEPALPPKPAVAPPSPYRPVAERAPVPPSKPREAVPKDIFDIIEEAPAKAEVKEAPALQYSPRPAKTAKAAEPDEEMFEVEPEYEVEPEPELEKPATSRLPDLSAAPKPRDEWAGLMTEERPEPAPGPLPTSESFDTDRLFGKEPAISQAPAAQTLEPAFETDAGAPGPEPTAPPSFDFNEPLSDEAKEALPLGQRAMDEMREGLGLGGGTARATDMHPDIVSFESLDMASRAPHEDYTFVPPAAVTPAAPPAAERPAVAPAAERPAAAPPRLPGVPDDMLKDVAKESIEKVMREILERVAWEVIPDLAERLIREEIERLKAESK
ncbi:MAG: response regulator [Nitrospirae bacterium]|nr:response regulator [Nitrospirota bacterium]NTW64721.1 response regulator [Nitrospirota bacterium]